MRLCCMVTAKVVIFVRALQTRIIWHCTIDDLRLASYIHVVPCWSRAITVRCSECSNVPSRHWALRVFQEGMLSRQEWMLSRHLMVKYGIPASEASTAVARSQAVRGWGTAWPYYSATVVYSNWVPLSLAHWLQRLASFTSSMGTCPWNMSTRDLGCVLARWRSAASWLIGSDWSLYPVQAEPGRSNSAMPT